MVSDVLIVAPLFAAFLLGLLVTRRVAWLLPAGLPVAFLIWVIRVEVGAYEGLEEGAQLGLVIVVPAYAAAWAVAVGGGYVLRRLFEFLGEAPPARRRSAR